MDDLRMRNPINLNRYVVKGKRLVAAEIEVCGFNSDNKAHHLNMRTVLKAWNASVVSDGSLPSGGVEINTHPAAGDRWHAQITDIMRAAHSAQVWVNSSAGCHIHVDCRDLGYLELAKVVRVIACVEPALYSIIPYFRTNSTYCHFWAINYLRALQTAEGEMTADMNTRRVTLIYRKELLRAVYGFSSKKEVDRVKGGKHHISRYRGTNIHSYLYRGTLEMRMPPGTIYPQNIINWGDLIAAIVDYAVDHSMVELITECWPIASMAETKKLYEKEYKLIPDEMVALSMKYLKAIAPTSTIKDWLIERQRWGKKLANASGFSEISKP